MKKELNPSVFWGIMVIAGTVIGGGMFALPVELSGTWFFWGAFILIITCFFMIHSGLFLLEANLNYPVGSNFNTITKDLLGKKWNFINSFAVAFVLYILIYAYISANSAIFGETLSKKGDILIDHRIRGILITIFVAGILWFSSKLANRITSLFLSVKIIAFVIVFGSLFFQVEYSILADINNVSENDNSHFIYLFMAIPVCLASFGFHGNIASLIIFYGKKKRTLIISIVLGALFALGVYLFWLYCTMGNIPRDDFKAIIESGGNVDSLVNAFISGNSSRIIEFLLLLFSNLAVASSFFGVSLGLFDFLADMFKFDNSSIGRLKTVSLTFLPPLLLYLFFPNGFIYGIGAAGLCATIWTLITPSVIVIKSRAKFKNQQFTVWGGKVLPILVFIFALVVIFCWFGNTFEFIPKFK
ncbi:low affinity tryptophan permease TnaB [Gilliamella sp. wkB112]|uniref:low affinity tryptophan permease TnaB n=1 Tax=Gilliamella sp. wkB112 TaxID=3120257 RepID=UPI00080ED467|nr:low affinity tryptophan permease TnaB [Gilliamella apicola]OCG03071.1 tryptophan permease [Gilliamella apicola]